MKELIECKIINGTCNGPTFDGKPLCGECNAGIGAARTGLHELDSPFLSLRRNLVERNMVLSDITGTMDHTVPDAAIFEIKKVHRRMWTDLPRDGDYFIVTVLRSTVRGGRLKKEYSQMRVNYGRPILNDDYARAEVDNYLGRNKR